MVGALLAWITASMRHGIETINLWHCWGVIEAQVALIVAFSSSLLFVQMLLIILLTISLKFYMGFRVDELAGQSSTLISWSAKHLEVVLALWAGAKILLEKEISISIKLVRRWKHEVFQNLLVDGCINFGLDKTQWTNTSRHHDTPNHHWLQKCHWTSSSLDSVPLQSSSRPWFPN